MQFFLPVMLSLTILASHPTQPVKFSLLHIRWGLEMNINQVVHAVQLYTSPQGALSTLHILLHQTLITHDHYLNINAIQNNKEIKKQRNNNEKKGTTKKF